MTELDRPLAASPEPPSRVFGGRFGFAKKAAIVLGGLALLALVISRIDFMRDMHRLDTGMLGGPSDGAYATVVSQLSAKASLHQGHLVNVSSAGSTENVTRLIDASRTERCDVSFALVQDGADFWPKDIASPKKKLELLGRLPKSESVFFLGQNAEKRFTTLAALHQMRIGVGPEAGGAARLARQIFALDDFVGLQVDLSFRPFAEQIAMAERGELDLVMLVIDEDAPLIVNPLREGRLEMAALPNLDVVARRIPRLRTGRIGAGQFNAVKLAPFEDRRVLRVDTLVIGNGCASRSATIDLLTLLGVEFPDFARHNKDTPNATGLDLTSTSKTFFEHGGPELADEYVPWLVDLMPPANWAYIIMGVSVLFNAMNIGHRFRLWRIDDARVKLEAELAALFGESATLGDIQRTKVTGKLLEPEARKHIDDLIVRFEALGGRSRRQSLSMLVPMGQEMAYRYQEGVIYQTLAVLRAFRIRWDVSVAPKSGASVSPTPRA